MRDKYLKYLLLAGFDLGKITDELVDKMVGGLRREFEHGFGERMPPEPEEALVIFEKALRDRAEGFRDEVVSILTAHISEEHIDQIVAFYESEAGKCMTGAMAAMMDKINDAQKAWHDETLKSIEGDFSRLLGQATGLTPENLNAALDAAGGDPLGGAKASSDV